MLASIKRTIAQKILKPSCSQLDLDKLSSLLQFTPVQKNTKLNGGQVSIQKSVLQKHFKVSFLESLESSTTNNHVNFTIPSLQLIKAVISDITCKASSYGKLGRNEQVYYLDEAGAIESLKRGLNVVVDYSSPNIAKPFHMGHLRSTVIGRFVVNVNRHFDQSTTSINYLGDWGTQFGYLSEGFKRYGCEEEMKKDPIKLLSRVYTQINKDTDIHHKAMKYFQLLEQGDEESRLFWMVCKEASLKEFQEVYKRLGVEFDEWWSESMFAESCKIMVEEMKKEGVAEMDGDGLTLMHTELGKAVLLKADGTSLYLTRDIASALERRRRFQADELIYVVDRSQQQHFQLLHSCLSKIGHLELGQPEMGQNEMGQQEMGQLEMSQQEMGQQEIGCLKIVQKKSGDKNLGQTKVGQIGGKVRHVKYGRVEGMSSRRGVGVLLEEVVARVEEEMAARMKDKKTTKVTTDAEIEDTAGVLGVSSIVVNDLKRCRMNNYAFHWTEALNFNGDSGVFMQYTHARLNNLLAAFADVTTSFDQSRVDLSLIDDVPSLRVVQHLARYEEVLLKSYLELEACHLVQYLFTLGRLVNLAHSQLQVKDQSKDLALARLLLFKSCLQTLKNAFQVLGIQPLDRI